MGGGAAAAAGGVGKMATHLLVVPFVLSLLVLGAAVDAAGALGGDPRLRRAAGVLLLLGSAAALLAFATGQGALFGALTRVHPADSGLEAHTQWGAVGAWVLGGAGLLRALWWRRLQGALGWAALAAALLSAALAVAISLSGLSIAHGG